MTDPGLATADLGLGLLECLSKAFAGADVVRRSTSNDRLISCPLTRNEHDVLPYFVLYMIDPSVALYKPFGISQVLKRFRDMLMLAPCCQGAANEPTRLAVWSGFLDANKRPHAKLWEHLSEKLDHFIAVWDGSEQLFFAGSPENQRGLIIFRDRAGEPYVLLAGLEALDGTAAQQLARRALVRLHHNTLLMDVTKPVLRQRAAMLGVDYEGKLKAELLRDVQAEVRKLRSAEGGDIYEWVRDHAT